MQFPPIDFQDIVYYSAPKSKADGPKSLDEVDPELLRTYEKLGVPLHERARLAGVAVDAVFDSVSVATTFQKQLGEHGVIFCSFSEAVRNHPELVRGEFALNEGGRTRIVNGRPLYVAVQNTEKVSHVVRMTAHGPGGHASVPLAGNALLRLGRALAALGAHRSPLT